MAIEACKVEAQVVARPHQPHIATFGAAATAPRCLRLAIVRQRYKTDGGAERFTAGLIAALGASHHEVTVLTRRWQSCEGVTAVRCNPPRLGRLTRDWGFALSVGRQLRRRRFDLVQSNERIVGCDVYRAGDGVHRAWLAQRRRVQSWPARLLSAVSPYHCYVQWTERRLFESPKLRAVICNSEMVRQEILRYFQVDPAKLHVIYNAVDTRRFAPHLRQHRAALRSSLGIPLDATLFAFVGSGFERKGLGTAIKCLPQVAGAHLVVVGYDKRRRQFERLAQRLGLADRVHFVGVQSNVEPYYGAADALVLPTMYDACPNVVLEAMASELPVVVSRDCGAAELMEPGKNGLVCDPLDQAAWVSALTELTDAETARRMGREARRRVEPLTPEAMAQQLTALYCKLLA